MKKKYIYTLKKVAKILGVSITQVKEFIWHGDLKAVGSRKEHVRYIDLVEFIGEPIDITEK